jgi:class 3 adenylate cyclase
VASESVDRKLAAILSADVVGYSRLMAEDEGATVRTVTVYREQIATLIREHRGRVVDSPGDNLLAEFPTATDAVQGAVEIQAILKVRNAPLPADRRMEFRIGIHLGEVRSEGDRLYGDGVNIAARLEGLAKPGGICISRTVHEQVQHTSPSRSGPTRSGPRPAS